MFSEMSAGRKGTWIGLRNAHKSSTTGTPTRTQGQCRDSVKICRMPPGGSPPLQSGGQNQKWPRLSCHSARRLPRTPRVRVPDAAQVLPALVRRQGVRCGTAHVRGCRPIAQGTPASNPAPQGPPRLALRSPWVRALFPLLRGLCITRTIPPLGVPIPTQPFHGRGGGGAGVCPPLRGNTDHPYHTLCWRPDTTLRQSHRNSGVSAR